MAGELYDLKKEHAECASRDLKELKRLRLEHAGCSDREMGLKDRVSELETEKEGWRKVSGEQAAKIKSLEADLKKTRLLLSDEEMSCQELWNENQDLAIRMGNVEIDRNKVVNVFIPEMVRRLFNSHEYKQSLAEPFNLYSQSRFLDGVALGRKPEELAELLEDVEGLDLEADETYQPLYDHLFSMDYPYIQKIGKTCQRSFKDLMEMFPDPAPV